MNEVDFLEQFFQTAIDKIVSNLYTMKDSKGHNRAASTTGVAQQVGEPDSKQIKEYRDKWVVQIYMPTYYEFIDEGVRGWANEKKNTGKFQFKRGRPIPLKVIREFMYNRGIVNVDYHSDKKLKKSRQTIDDKLNQLAFVIGRSIKKKGTEGVPFYSSVMTEDFYNSFETDFLNVYGDKLLNDIEFLFKVK